MDFGKVWSIFAFICCCVLDVILGYATIGAFAQGHIVGGLFLACWFGAFLYLLIIWKKHVGFD